MLSDLNSPDLYVYDVRSGSNEPLTTLKTIARGPVTALRYVVPADTVVSADTKVRECVGKFEEVWRVGVGLFEGIGDCCQIPIV